MLNSDAIYLPEDKIHIVKEYLLLLQENICNSLTQIDTGNVFLKDVWKRDGGGGGITRVLNKGKVFAKAGVNFSHITGDALPKAATVKRPELSGCKFDALGVSVVIHPENPFVPTTHCNVRFFSAETKDKNHIWWFGGGFDLTPYYGFYEDAKYWHETARLACEGFGIDLYQKLKEACDNYFYLKHRNETRGIGGIFFDDFSNGGFENSFNFMQSVGSHFLKAYIPIVLKRKDIKYDENEKNFQLYRRGRYVEFNLIYDRGTLFGLESGGRTESIFVSLPPEVNWIYNYHPALGSAEEKLYRDFLKPQNWVDYNCPDSF